MRKSVIVLLFVVAFTFGCAAEYVPSPTCLEDPGIILSVTQGNPTGADRALILANVVGLEREEYTPQEAYDYLNDLRGKVIDGVSYSDFSSRLKEINKNLRVAALLVGDNVQTIVDIGGTKLIQACDQELILTEIDRQLIVVSAYL